MINQSIFLQIWWKNGRYSDRGAYILISISESVWSDFHWSWDEKASPIDHHFSCIIRMISRLRMIRFTNLIDWCVLDPIRSFSWQFHFEKYIRLDEFLKVIEILPLGRLVWSHEKFLVRRICCSVLGMKMSKAWTICAFESCASYLWKKEFEEEWKDNVVSMDRCCWILTSFDSVRRFNGHDNYPCWWDDSIWA